MHWEQIHNADKVIYKTLFVSFFEMMDVVCENEGIAKDRETYNNLMALIDGFIQQQYFGDLVDIFLFQ